MNHMRQMGELIRQAIQQNDAPSVSAVSLTMAARRRQLEYAMRGLSPCDAAALIGVVLTDQLGRNRAGMICRNAADIAEKGN